MQKELNELFDLSSLIDTSAFSSSEKSEIGRRPPPVDKIKSKAPPITPMKGLRPFQKIIPRELKSGLPTFSVGLAGGNVIFVSNRSYDRYHKENSTTILKLEYVHYTPYEGDEVHNFKCNITLQLNYNHQFNLRHGFVPVTVRQNNREFKLPGQLFVHHSPYSPDSKSHDVLGLELWFHPSAELSENMNLNELIPADVSDFLKHTKDGTPIALPDSKLSDKPHVMGPKWWNLSGIEAGMTVHFSNGRKLSLHEGVLERIKKLLKELQPAPRAQRTPYRAALLARATPEEFELASVHQQTFFKRSRVQKHKDEDMDIDMEKGLDKENQNPNLATPMEETTGSFGR